MKKLFLILASTFLACCSLYVPCETTYQNGTGGSSGNGNGNGSGTETETEKVHGVLNDDITEQEELGCGLCYNNLNADEIAKLKDSKVKWVYNWAISPGEDELLKAAGIMFVPQQWGLSTETTRENLRTYYKNHTECKYLMGYNEPNLGGSVGGSSITPKQAAADWENLEAIAEEFGLALIGPALQYSGETLSDGKCYGSPEKWMDAFIAEYQALHDGKSPKVDYFNLHCYMNWPGALEWYVKNYYKMYGRKIYLTEFCAWEYNNGGQNESMENQTSSMKEKVAFMDSYSGCAGYAWFMSHGQTSNIPFNSIYEAKGADGTLTSLGKAYLGKE